MTLDRNDNDTAPFDHARAIRFVLLTAGAICAAATVAQDAGQPLADVLATDRDFAALARETDLRAAFERYLASDAVLMRPLPQPGREWLANSEAVSGEYAWSPSGAIVSCDGSLAVTVGRWQYVPAQSRTVETGEYLTAWRRNAQGDWQIVLDQAVDLDPLDRIAKDIQVRSSRTCPRGSKSTKKLDALEDRANAALRIDPAAGTAGPMAGRRQGTIVGDARSDLVLTYGEVMEPGRFAEPGAAPAVYVRIWQRSRSDWVPVLEVVTPVAR